MLQLGCSMRLVLHSYDQPVVPAVAVVPNYMLLRVRHDMEVS
jgi:hypothetical protein